MNAEKYINRTYEKFEKAAELYSKYIFEPIEDISNVFTYRTYEHLRRPPEKESMKIMEKGEKWGGEYANIWLRFDYTVPENLKGEQLCVVPDTQFAEVLCFLNNKPAGIINSKNKFIGGDHSVMFLTENAIPGENFDIALECYAGQSNLGESPYAYYGWEEKDFAYPERIYELYGVKILKVNKLMKDFVFDLVTVIQLAKLKKPNIAALRAHECLMNAFPYMILDTDGATLDELNDVALKVREIMAPALKKRGADRSRGKIGIIGHSHMDTAWLWPVSETVRKCARTYSQALKLMDMYDDYSFIQSSALHLDWMREYYPDIFEKIKKRVKEGRYEPNGGVWVECDCNITGAESMVRQFLWGQKYTEKHFGYRSDTFWLPDTFGYNAAIPQIMRKSGVKYFYTTKIGWNDLNKFPSDSFVWRGIDGSEVISHFHRQHFTADVETFSKMIEELRDKFCDDTRLAAFGYGDGGGGPTYGMCEFIKREKDLEGMPVIENTTVSKFMKDLEERKDKLPLHDGELYLEYHRGTLTTMHEVKKNNRTAEISLHDMELLNVICESEANEKLYDLYRTTLVNQFHDILPGTSIPKVYERTVPEMREVIKTAKEESGKYLDKLTEKNENKISLYNTLSFDRNDIAVLDGEYNFTDAKSQTYEDNEGNIKTAVKVKIPAFSAVTLNKGKNNKETKFIYNDNKLITPYYEVIFDENGYISSLYDKEAEREVKREGGNSLGTIYIGEDMPHNHDNWEINDDVFMNLRPVDACVSRETISVGEVQFRIRSKYNIGKRSEAIIDTVFYAENRRIDFEMKVDWHERHILMKAGFDLDIRSAFIKNEIQFGNIDRPTTKNTSLETAMFEICNHKWSDISETHYGVAILNDCKYGLSAEGSNIRLTLHKGGTRPDPITDNGVHTMVYSLLPHLGAFDAEKVIHPAYELNYKHIIKEGKIKIEPLFTVSNPGIICESVKNSEDGIKNAYVIRLYEAERNHSNTLIKFNHKVKNIYLTDMLEEKEKELTLKDNTLKLKFKPFEIITLLIER